MNLPPLPPIALTEVLFQAALGLFATLGFAVWFNVPRETLSRAALVGTCGFLVRFALLKFGHSPAIASFWAAFFIGIFGYYRARTFRYPRVIFTVTGIIPMVPGIPAYEALVHFTKGDVNSGLQSAVKATLVLGALAGGLTAARALTMRRRKQVA